MSQETVMLFDIPKEWLDFCEYRPMSSEYRFYPFDYERTDIEIIFISDIEPPKRAVGVPTFKKNKMVPVLMALMNPNGELPPVVVSPFNDSGLYKYKLKDGFHRFYASVLCGYKQILAVINPQKAAADI